MKLFYTIFFLFSLQFYMYSQTTVSGKVVGEDMENLIGATILIEGSGKGTATDGEGNFSIKSDVPAPFTLKVSYAGYTSKELEIAGDQLGITITLSSGVNLDDVIISASRKREKIQEAPASVSVLGTRQLAVIPDIDPTRSLGTLPGVTIQQQSAGRINIEMRGANDNFTTSVFPILDYRNLISAGTGIFNSANNGISTIDLERIEVVRGPGSALYGAGVTSGVIHYISKSPISHPGTTVEVMGGELNTFVLNARHATKVSDKFGFKVNVNYRRGDEFGLNPNDSTDAMTIALLQNSIRRPDLVNGRAAPFGEGTLLADNLDEDGDGSPLLNSYNSFSANTTLEFRPTDDFSVNISGGINNYQSLYNNAQGEGIDAGFEYWTQARMQYKGLFAQVFYSNNDNALDADLPTSSYRNGLQTGVARQGLESQVQYNFGLPKAKIDFTTGFDTRTVFSDSRNLTYGRYEDDDNYTIMGVYAQGDWAMTPKLDLLIAGRYDDFNFLDDGFISPRAALVYKPSSNHTVRGSYNRAARVPSAITMYADLPGPGVVPGLMGVWFAGLNTQHTFGDNSAIDVTIPGVPNLPIGTPGMPLAIPYGAVTPGLIDAIAPSLGSDPLGIIPFLQGYTPTGITGELYGWNIFQGPETPLAVQDNLPAQVEKNTTYELGYSGFIKNKLKLTLDVYNTTIDGATIINGVAPVYSLLGADSGSGLSAEIEAALTTHLQGMGVPDADIPGIVLPIAAGYMAAGQGFDDPVAGAGGLYPVFGAAESDSGVVPLDDDIVHVAASFNIIDGDINYTGIDLGSQYYFTDEIIGYFNYSWLSKTLWEPGKDDVSGTYSLNTAKNRFRAGVQYVPSTGLSGSLGFQHLPSYNAVLGVFSGETDEQNLVDLNLGYGFDNGLKVGVNVTNLFNSQYRYTPVMPRIGRQALARISYTFGPEGN